MKITIYIPKEFEEHWKDDRFKDSLSRLRADAYCLAGNYEKELIDILIKAFNYATVEVEEIKGEKMPRYINAEADYLKPYFYGHLDDNGMVAAQNAIDDVPTANVVEVVRCKYCKHHTYEEPGMVYCPNHIVGGWVEECFFCKDGERREDE